MNLTCIVDLTKKNRSIYVTPLPSFLYTRMSDVSVMCNALAP